MSVLSDLEDALLTRLNFLLATAGSPGPGTLRSIKRHHFRSEEEAHDLMERYRDLVPAGILSYPFIEYQRGPNAGLPGQQSIWFTAVHRFLIISADLKRAAQEDRTFIGDNLDVFNVAMIDDAFMAGEKTENYEFDPILVEDGVPTEINDLVAFMWTFRVRVRNCG